MYKFRYRPDYLDVPTARFIENTFYDWLDQTGLKYENIDLILDGGNFVYDPVSNRVVITHRVIKDNPRYTRESIAEFLHQVRCNDISTL